MKNITIAKLNTLVTANASQFQKEMDRAAYIAKNRGGIMSKALSSVSSSLKGGLGGIVAGVSIGGIIGFGKSVMELGDKISDLAEEANMTPRAFQVLSATAMQNGMDMEAVAKASDHLRTKLQDASANGSDPLNKSLAKLHLTAAGLKGLSPELQWQVIGERIANAADKQEAFNIVGDLFGDKIGPKMRATLAELSKGYEAAAEKSKAMIFTDEELKQLADANKSLERGWMMTKVAAVQTAKGAFEPNNAQNFGMNLAEKVFGLFSTSGLKSRGLPDVKDLVGSADIPIKKDTGLEAKMKAAEDAALLKKIRDTKFEPMSEKDYRNGFMTPEEFAKEHFRKKEVHDATPTDQYSRIGLMSGSFTPARDTEPAKMTKEQRETNQILTRILTKLNGGAAAFAN